MALLGTLRLAARPMAKIILCLTMIFPLIMLLVETSPYPLKMEEGGVSFRYKPTTYRWPKGKGETDPNT
ncbi:hypothetical protein [Halomonas sp. MES3-P3E]|uniref:hypothetical protein n=1 Tax=Halomonas sp. MES3-P3E TaxID=2058321 RepID=UPI000C3286D1|nr:hypothetical protein [Halomonas sp. MES3-P3E]PKG49590.1 hypothetical protein CXF87_12315 [Halomonas sp. MES3-P3E]